MLSGRPKPNVFVLCTGRCGSTTFAKACGHITNFTSGHETNMSRLGPARLDYAQGHIEVDNRLAWFLGKLERRYTDAHFVHLTRDPEAVAESFANRIGFGILNAYKTQILWRAEHQQPEAEPIEFARDFVETVTTNICRFLADKAQVMRFELEQAETQWPEFWDWIGAEGDMAAAQAEFGRKYNAWGKADG